MEAIFHEKQEGYLCAQHCLNALLQGPYFNVVDLANLAHQMDEEERIRMAESGVHTEDYQHFLEQPSGNMDDSGYFSVQVISSALKVLGLELIPYTSSTEPTALLAQKDPVQMKAYICNYKGHWFTIRKLGRQWFNLNSLLKGPQLISDGYLTMFLMQLIHEGYSIFIVIGTFPQCIADEVLANNPVVAPPVRTAPTGSSKSVEEDDADKVLQKAVELSLEDTKKEDSDESFGKNSRGKLLDTINLTKDSDEDEDLRRALQLSLECVSDPITPDPEDTRWRRLNHFDSYPIPKESQQLKERQPQKLNT